MELSVLENDLCCPRRCLPGVMVSPHRSTNNGNLRAGPGLENDRKRDRGRDGGPQLSLLGLTSLCTHALAPLGCVGNTRTSVCLLCICVYVCGSSRVPALTVVPFQRQRGWFSIFTTAKEILRGPSPAPYHGLRLMTSKQHSGQRKWWPISHPWSAKHNHLLVQESQINLETTPWL